MEAKGLSEIRGKTINRDMGVLVVHNVQRSEVAAGSLRSVHVHFVYSYGAQGN